jgi:alpha-glucosidase
MARRKGKTWYVAAIEGEKKLQKLSLALSFLGKGSFTLNMISDNETGKGFMNSQKQVTSADKINLDVMPKGGFVAVIFTK